MNKLSYAGFHICRSCKIRFDCPIGISVGSNIINICSVISLSGIHGTPISVGREDTAWRIFLYRHHTNKLTPLVQKSKCLRKIFNKPTPSNVPGVTYIHFKKRMIKTCHEFLKKNKVLK